MRTANTDIHHNAMTTLKAQLKRTVNNKRVLRNVSDDRKVNNAFVGMGLVASYKRPQVRVFVESIKWSNLQWRASIFSSQL